MQMVFRPINIQFNCLVLLQMYNKDGNIYLIVCRFLERGLKREHEPKYGLQIVKTRDYWVIMTCYFVCT